MNTILKLLGAIALIAAIAAVWVRTAPDDPADWHVDPVKSGRTGRPNDALRGPVEGADGAAPVWAAEPDRLMAAFDKVARAAPRTELLAGGPEAGLATYVQRSAVMGFPDYISVRALPVEGGATLAIWSRARYGHSDMGVNAARLDDWLGAIDLPRLD